MPDRPDATQLWEEAGGGTPGFDAERWRALIRERMLGEGSEFPDPDDVQLGTPQGALRQAAPAHPRHRHEQTPLRRGRGAAGSQSGPPPARPRQCSRGYSTDTRDIERRALLAVRGMIRSGRRLARISGWHAGETGPAGTVGDYCTECRA